MKSEHELIERARLAVAEDHRVRNMPGWEHDKDAIRGMHPNLVCELFEACFREFDRLAVESSKARTMTTFSPAERTWSLSIEWTTGELMASSMSDVARWVGLLASRKAEEAMRGVLS